jgi:hypothetical protein
MTTPVELRSQLLTLLKPYLGKYSFGTDAFAVLPDPDLGYDYPPSGTKVEGLEVILQLPYPQFMPLMGNNGVTRKWQILLKQWDSSKNLIEALEAIVKANFDLFIGKIVVVPPNEALGTIEQARIELLDYSTSE